MLATVMYAAHDVRVVKVPDAVLIESTDAVVRVTLACVCGSDLWPYRDMARTEGGQSMGHEAIGVVEAVGRSVSRIRVGDTVIMPFAYSDGSCHFCHEGLQTACVHGGFFGYGGFNGAQAEALRVPHADGTLFALGQTIDPALWASLLCLSDVMGTGHHAARVARVAPGQTAAVIGDGAVGLCGVIAAKRLSAERIILLGRHPDRIALGREFGATDIVSERGDDAIARVMELTGGEGAHSVLECVGAEPSMHPSEFHSCLRPSPGLAARSDASVFPTTRAFRPAQPSTRTSSSAAVQHRCEPTLTNCCPMCSTAASIRAACSTATSACPRRRWVIRPWIRATPSRS